MSQSDGKNKLQRMTFEFKGQFYHFAVNPQEFQQQEPSRSTITQTKGGAWVDDFGAGLQTIYMKGMTGFQKGAGFERWKKLRDTLRAYYNDVTPGQTLVDELIFHNLTDDENWVVHIDPNSGFKLYRSVSNPLIYQYEIYMVCLRSYDKPSTSASSGVAIGNPMGSALPYASNVPNASATPLYQYAMPFIGHAVQSNEIGQIPNAVAGYVSKPSILSNGSVQLSTGGSIGFLAPNPLRATSSSVNVDPVLDAQISSLSVQFYNSLALGNSPYSTDYALDNTSLVYRIINDENSGVTPEMKTVLQACLLEVAAINYQLTTDPNSLSNNVSQSDLSRLIQNLRWVNNQLSGVPNFDLTILEDLRWLERCVQYVMQTPSLFSVNVSQSITDYQNALGGV